MNKQVAMAVAAIVGMSGAHATEILTLGQSMGGTSPVTGTASGSMTTISADASVTITSCVYCPGGYAGTDLFTLNATSVGPAMTVGSGFVSQKFDGTFTITQGSKDVLSGSFTDAIFGAGSSLTLSASSGFDGASVNFTSNVIPLSGLEGDKAMSLSFADVTPPVSITNGGTLGSFTGSLAGTFSASLAGVPEPGSLGLMAAGLGVLGLVGYRRKRK
jgi:hypothetical protein